MKPPSIALSTAALAAALSAGCSVEPPVPIETDPAYAHVALEQRARPRVRLGVAPVLVTFDGPSRLSWPPLSAAAVSSATPASPRSATVTLADAEPDPLAAGPGVGAPAPPTPTAADAELPRREYQWRPTTIEPAAIQARLAELLRWAVAGGRVAVVDGPAGDREALARAAEAAGAQLLVQAEVTGARAAWVDREGAWFWADALVFYGLGLPMAWIENEVFEVSLAMRVAVVHARTGQALLSSSFVGRHERAMNDPQRGWSLGGFFFLHPWTLDEDDLQVVYEALVPHAQKELEGQVAAWLKAELPARLAQSQVRALFDGADVPEARSARTFALLVGAPGPHVASLDRPPPLAGATRDVEAVAALLRDAREVAQDRLVLLQDQAATRTRLLEALGALGERMATGDRLLLYYAGYGWFDTAGKASLLLDGEAPLSLHALADAVARLLPEGTQVVFVLDTSFGGGGGRTYPGAPTSPDAALLPLARRPGWQALVASQPGRPALEEDGAGLFTRWLVAGAKGAADTDGDRTVDLRELERYLRDWVRSDSIERLGEPQVPVRLGSEAAPARLVRVLAAR